MARILLALALFTAAIPLTIPPDVPYKPVKQALKEWECKAWAVWDESRGEPLEGSRAVLDVIQRRMKRRKKTACEIVSEHKQFSGWKGDDAVRNIPPAAVVRYERVRKMKPVASRCTHFHATYVSPKWASTMQPCYQVGKHVFYFKEKKYGTERREAVPIEARQ